MKLNRRSGSISAGDLKDRCSLLQPTYTSNGRGGQDTTFATYATVWCKATPSSNSRELVEAQITYYDAFHFTIRKSEVPIKSDWHIDFNGRTYTIHTVDDIENRYQYLKILAYSKNK